MLRVGEPVEDFTLEDDRGQPVHWAALRGQPVVLFAYPRANTPGCTTEATDFRDRQADFDALGVRLFGISADKVATQARFRDKHGLTMPLLSDPERRVLAPWGIWAEKKNYGRTYMGIVRTTALFDADGTLARLWSKVRVKGHAQAVLEAARERYG